MSQLGLNCKFYVKTAGSWASPTWTLADCVDVTVNMDRNVIPAPSRGSVWEKGLPGLKKFSLSVKFNRSYADTVQAAIKAAYDAGDAIIVAVADGLMATVGTNYIKAECLVGQFQMGEPLEGVVPLDITLSPDARSANDPTFVTVAS